MIAAAPETVRPPGWLGGAGLVAGIAFVVNERLRTGPMLPLGLFRSRAFSAATGVGVLFNRRRPAHRQACTRNGVDVPVNEWGGLVPTAASP